MSNADLSKPQVSIDEHVEYVEKSKIPFDNVDADVNAWVGLNEEARAATDEEHNTGIFDALRKYPKAVFWSVVISLVVIMDGYDTALMGSLTGFPSFQKRFGVPQVGSSGSYQLQARWILALNLGSPCGNIIGIFLQGFFSERLGHRKTIILGLIFIICPIFLLFFATSVEMLFVGEFLAGLPWGIFTTIAPAYASEVAPVSLRAALETWIVLCWGIGQFIAWAVLDSLDTSASEWSWRIPFAVQWVWPVIIIPLVLIAPESPWWLVRKGRLQAAERSVQRLSSSKVEGCARNAVALMVETTNLEKEITSGAGWIDCFRGSNRWRTEITCMAWLTQACAGFAIAQFASYFFEQAGLPSAQAYKLTLGQGGLALVFNILSMFLTRHAGRRSIYLGGCLVMTLNWLVVGFLALRPNDIAIAYASSALYMFWLCLYQLTIGPIAFIVVGETSSTRLRSYTISLARNAYNVWNIMSTCVAPYVLDPNQGDWKGKSAFLPAGLLAACFIWGFFRLPECKGRTYEELDILFQRKISARKFGSYEIDLSEAIADLNLCVDDKPDRMIEPHS